MQTLLRAGYLILALAAAQAALGQGAVPITGTNPDGSRYQGTLQRAAYGRVEQLHWNTGSISQGIGVRVGDALAVAVGGNECAVVGYRIGPEGGLDGVWSSPELLTTRSNLGTERATPSGRLRSLAGDYAVNGTNGNGSPYRGSLSIRSEGEHWRLSWRTGTQFEGFGIERGGYLAVAWGAPTCGVVLYRVDRRNNLDGIWKYRNTGIGTEATRR